MVCAYLALLTCEDFRRASAFPGVVTPASAKMLVQPLPSTKSPIVDKKAISIWSPPRRTTNLFSP